MQTPYYVIDKNELDSNFDKLKKALDDTWNNYVIGYSYKTNALPYVISYFDGCGCYAEVVSEDEYRLAKAVGVARDRIIYNGPIKTKDSFTQALRDGAYVNIDSGREIEWLAELEPGDFKLGIRVNFDIEKFAKNQSQCGEEGGRFGFSYENGELAAAIERINRLGHRVAGIHLHTSSKSRGLDIYEGIAKMAVAIADEYKLDLSFIDVGGGFFGGLANKPQFIDYMTLMKNILSERFDSNKVVLIVEPGMSLIGPVISYVTEVIDVKTTNYNHFVVTDGSRTSIDPLMTKVSYFHDYERDENEPCIPKQVICGYTCMEHDRLFEAIDEPMLKVHDKIIYHKVGAYTMCLTPLFIKYFPDVYVLENGEYTKVREKWDEQDYLSKAKLYLKK